MIRAAIIEQLDIVAVVQNCINLEKKGNNYVGLCPFHNDQKPSLFVSESKQIFKCFVCNVGGDAIKFWMRFYNASFRKTVNDLAKQFNLELETTTNEEVQVSQEHQEIIAINQEATIFFQFNLANNAPQVVKAYCQKRGITNKMMQQFQIGWIGDDDQTLWTYLLKKQFRDVNILNSDLFQLNRVEKPISYFRQRLIFPIKNEDGQVVGFVGRTITDQPNQPKYLNSRENIAFSKNKCLYNFDQVKKHFRAINQIYLVEGLLDSIRLINHQYPAIATMGTNLSQYQINLLKEQYEEVIIFPDNDQAGKISTIKNSLMLLKNKMKVKIIAQNVGKDADECLQKTDFDLTKTKQLMPIDFLIAQYPQNSSTQEIEELIYTIKPFFPYVSDVQEMKTKENITQKYQLGSTIWKTNSPPKVWKKPDQEKDHQGKKVVAWKTMLFARLLYHPEIIAQAITLEGTFNDLDYDFYYQELIKWYNLRTKAGKKLFFENFLKTLSDEKKRWLISFYQQHENKSEVMDGNLKFTNDCLKKFQAEAINLEIEKIKKKVKNNGDDGNLLVKIRELIKKRNKINHQ